MITVFGREHERGDDIDKTEKGGEAQPDSKSGEMGNSEGEQRADHAGYGDTVRKLQGSVVAVEDVHRLRRRSSRTAARK